MATEDGLSAANLPRLHGHSAGISNIRPVIDSFAEHGVEYLTLYAFSTENWTRPQEEVAGLLEFLAAAIKDETQYFHERGVRLVHLGRIDRLAPDIQSAIREAVDLTKDNRYITVCIAFDYGGRAEILSAIRQIVEDGVDPSTIDEELISDYLYTRDIPDPDLIIRTAGEMRLSNFLIWQSAYSEYYFTPKAWARVRPGRRSANLYRPFPRGKDDSVASTPNLSLISALARPLHNPIPNRRGGVLSPLPRWERARVRVNSSLQSNPFALSPLQVRREGSKGLKSGLFRVQGRAKP